MRFSEKESSQRGKCYWMQGRKGSTRKSATFFSQFNVTDVVPHNSAWWFPVRQEVTSQGHCFSFLYGLHEKRPFSPAAPQYAACDPHKTVKRNNGPSLCAYCLYTHHMSHRTECHHRMAGTSTSSVGAAPLYNVWDASFLSRCTNLQPTQSLSVKKWSVMLARWHTESH